MKRILLMACCFLLFAGSLHAQQSIVTGKVTDGKDGSALPGVTVQVKSSTRGTVTDANGNFNVEVSPSDVLVFSFIGFASQEILAGTQTSINVPMVVSAKELSEVIVIGYGSREKKDVTGAISTMNADEISKSTQMNPELAMQGRMAGVFVGTASGDPFARPTVQIRGVATFGYAQPLYVIDGIPVLEGGASNTDAGAQDVRSPISIMSSINPSDIESMSVLKDASAAAIYGVRASNGVILITTKKGKAGKTKVEFNSSYGFQDVRKKFSMLNTPDYTSLYQEVYANNPTEAANLPAQFKSGDPAYLGNSPTYDWQSKLINKNAPITDNSIRVSGGNESTTYYISGGYGKTNGSLIQNYLERYSLASNITSKVNKYIETGVNLKLSYNNAKDNNGTDLSYVSTAPPWQPIYGNDITGYAPSVAATFVPNPDFDPSLLNPGPAFNFASDPTYNYGPATRGNVFATQSLTSNTYNVFRTIGTAYLQIEPIKGLKVKGSVNEDYNFNLRKNWTDYDSWRFSQTPGNPYSGHDGTAKGGYGERQSRTSNFVKELTVNYNRGFGDHNIDLLFNAMDQKQIWSVTDASTGQVNFTDPDLRSVINKPPYNGTFANHTPQALQGYLGRVSYKFRDKYYVDATVRRDASSKFAPAHRWGTFASFAAGWRISSEQFFKNLNLSQINDLKFRGGSGELGNMETTQGFAYLSTISTSPDYSFGSGLGNAFGTQYTGAAFPNYPNFDLTWERVRTSNVGFDATLFSNHVTFTAEYYDRFTKGIIQNVQLPPNSGIQTPTAINVGNVKNNGIELQLGYRTTVGAWSFNVSGNLTTVKNRITKLYQGTPFGGETGRNQEGQSIGYLWGYKVGGIFQNAQQVTDWKTNFKDNIGTNNQQPGDMYFQDVAGDPAAGQISNPKPDGVINNNDHTYLGKTIAGYYYGFNLGAGYKGFDLSIFFQGVGDLQKYDFARAGGEQMSGNGQNQWTTTKNRWTGENTSTVMPRAVRNDPNSNNRFSSRFVESAAFMRLKNLQLGYTVPASLLGRKGVIERVRIYVSSTNLLTFTKWKGIDPENDINPPTRQFLVGFNAAF
jgi:TonB-dependent starch-binding outer membrane protein SusC